MDYSEKMVARWLAARMCASGPEAMDLANRIARHFNDATTHKSHGRRIDRAEARAQGVIVEDLEANQTLQECVLTAYHLVSILFEKSPNLKLLTNNRGRMWIKNLPSGAS